MNVTSRTVTTLPLEGSVELERTVVDWIALGTKVSAEQILSWSMAQIWGRVSVGNAPGGLMGEVNAILFVEDGILTYLLCSMWTSTVLGNIRVCI